MNKPNYAVYTIEELIESKESINRDAWPERFIEIEDRIQYLIKSSPAEKAKYNELVFLNFCESLRTDLSYAVDDDILSILRLFSKKAEAAIPSTFQGEVCPLCKGELEVSYYSGSWFSFTRGWLLTCRNCNTEGIVEQYQHR